MEATMDKKAYLQAFLDNWEGIQHAATLGMEPAVPSCPGWNVGALVGHMGGVFTFWNKWVRERPRGYDDVAFAELRAEREAGLPGFGAWRKKSFAFEELPPGVMEFAQRYQTELEDRLRELVAPAGSSITYSCVLRQGFRRRAAGGAVRVLMFQTTRSARDGVDVLYAGSDRGIRAATYSARDCCAPLGCASSS
jgi:hypothetical protein